MELSRTKMAGSEINVIYTGARYIFISSFFGIVGVAVRDYDYSKTHNDGQRFALEYDNRNTLGCSISGCIVPGMQRFIRATECRYRERGIVFDDLGGCDINRKYYLVDPLALR